MTKSKTNVHNLKTVAKRIVMGMLCIVKVLFVLAILLGISYFCLNKYKESIKQILSEKAIENIRNLLKVFFGSKSVFKSLIVLGYVYLGGFAFALTCACMFASFCAIIYFFICKIDVVLSYIENTKRNYFKVEKTLPQTRLYLLENQFRL